MLFNRQLKGRARDWNWHNVIGFWSAFPMLLIILTGVIMSYGWANNLLFTITGNVPPPPREKPAGAPGGTRTEGGRGGVAAGVSAQSGGGVAAGVSTPSGGPGRPAGPPPSFAGLEPLLAQTQQQIPDWRSLSLRTPIKPGNPFPVMVDRGGRGEVHRRTMLNLDPAQGKVLPSPDDITQQNLGRRLRMYSRFLHTGELFGLIGQTVAALCALAAALLVWTGFALAWRRFIGRKSSAS